MNKKEVQKRVLKDGKPLSFNLFTWNEKTNIFSSNVYDLVIDFNGIRNCTFITNRFCTLITGSSCTFKTGSYCTFMTRDGCTFDTGYRCVVMRGDVLDEVIDLKESQKIRLKPSGIKGYEILE